MWQIDVQKQRGMGKWSWLFLVIVIISVGATALRLGPHYIDFEMVKGTLDRLPENTVHGDMSRADIRDHFQRQFRIENFTRPVREIVNIARDREQTVVSVAYEVREPLAYNVDVVLAFTDERTYK